MHKSSFKSHSLYQLINDATDNLLDSENDNLNKQICSEIMRSSDGPKVAAKVINKIVTKSLSSKCSQSIWYCLLLLDLAVKSTDSRFCSAVLSKDFFGDLIKVMDPKYQVPEFVQEKFLYIVKEWYESLTNVSGYQNLVKFYKTQMSPSISNSAPSSTQRPYPVDNSSVSSFFPRQVSQFGCLEKEKIIRDIDAIETNLSIFSDTLRTINPGQMTTDEEQFLKDLYESNKTIQGRINDVLPQMMWEDITNQLLQVNDKINSTTERYLRLVPLYTENVLDKPTDQFLVEESIDNICGRTSSLRINDNGNRIVSDIYDIPSLPSYNEASSYLNKTKNTNSSQDVNLINFEDDVRPSFYNALPLPPIPSNNNSDLLTEPKHVSPPSQNVLSSEEFDDFIETLARRHQKTPEVVSDEDYAPPLYDETASKRSS